MESCAESVRSGRRFCSEFHAPGDRGTAPHPLGITAGQIGPFRHRTGPGGGMACGERGGQPLDRIDQEVSGSASANQSLTAG